MSIAENIKRLRASSGMTQEDFGKIADVSAMAVSQWENARATPRMGAMQRLAEHFGVSLSELIDDGDKPKPPLPGAMRVVSGGGATVPLRVLGTVHAGEPESEPEADSEVMVPRDVAEAHPSAWAVRVEGDCMDRVVPPGHVAVVDPDLPAADGAVVVCRLDDTDEVVMRRLRLGRTTAMLVADSFAPHEDLTFPADGPAVRVLGRVVWEQGEP